MAKYALIIGIPTYRSPKFTDLPKTTTDAEQIAQILEQHGGFMVTRLPRQGNEQSDGYVMKAAGVNQDSFVTTLQQFIKRASGHEALIYFTGHGYTVVDELDSEDERGYLATSDCLIETEGDRIIAQKKGIPLASLGKLLQKANFSSLVMLLDCCYGGSFLVKTATQQNLQVFNQKQGYYLITACREFETAKTVKSQAHSVFSGAAIEGLSEIHADERGEISCNDLYSFIRRQIGGKLQEPIFLSGGRGITLVRYEPKASKLSLEKLCLDSQEAVAKVNSYYLKSLKDKVGIAGQVIDREESKLIYNKLIDFENKKSILITGEAGVGKSGVMLQVAQKLEENGTPFLAFRVDRLAPTHDPDLLIPQLPSSPATVLANIARDRKSVLIIDQLDAVSTASGRNPDFFDCIEHLIRQVESYPNMKFIIACRKFDLNNDFRFRRISQNTLFVEKITVNLLSAEVIKTIIESLDIDYQKISPVQKKLLSLPLHLNLFAEITSEGENPKFVNSNDLYRTFWERKQEKIKEKINRPVQWTSVIKTLCDRMSHDQTLSVSEASLDQYSDDAKIMASENVLVHSDKRFSFFHEGFFDYAFARSFSAKGQSILDFLKGDDQQLFCRAQVRQILTQLRESDFTRYLRELQELLHDPDIRFHIKYVIFAWLGYLTQPSEDEWKILKHFLDSPESPEAQQIWRMFWNESAVGWFRLLDRLGLIKDWLDDDHDQEEHRKVFGLLSWVAVPEAKRVVQLLRPYLVKKSNYWFERFLNFANHRHLEQSRDLFEFFLELIEHGICDQEPKKYHDSRDFWHHTYFLVSKNSEWVCEAIGKYLNHQLDRSIELGEPNPFSIKGTLSERRFFFHDTLKKASKEAPTQFISAVLPFIIRVLDLILKDKEYNDLFCSENNIFNVNPEKPISSLDDVLILYLGNALIDLSKISITECRNYLKRLSNYRFCSIRNLIMKVYVSNASEFADEAVNYLSEDITRLKTGYSFGNGNIHAGAYWSTGELIQAITPHCSDENIYKLEKMLLDYYPNWQRRQERYRKDNQYRESILALRGYPQFVLLDAIFPKRRSVIVNRRIQEWQRKFISLELLDRSGIIEPPRQDSANLVGSPVPSDAVEKMSDVQWLKAISHYHYNNWRHQVNVTREKWGGALQLSSELQKQTANQPKRFTQLLLHFPEDSNIHYFNAVLGGLAEANDVLDLTVTTQAILRCHELPNRPCGKSILWLLQKQPKLSWSSAIFDVLIWYALNDPDPQQELWCTDSGSGQVYYGGDPHSAGINSVRGSAFGSISRLIFANSDHGQYFETMLHNAVQDPSIAVRTCIAEALKALLNYNRDLAVELFLQLCDTEEIILGCGSVENFLYWALPTHFDLLKPIIEKMLVSEIPSVLASGSRQACCIALELQDAKSLATQCLSGSVEHRKAAAEVFVTNLTHESIQAVCESSLIQLFNDSELDVRKEASRCLWKLKGEDITKYSHLLESFIESPAFLEDSYSLTHALKEATAKLPDLTYKLCEQFIDNLIDDEAPNTYRGSAEIMELLVRLYSQTGSTDLKKKCLDLIDLMCEIDVYGVRSQLEEFDRH